MATSGDLCYLVSSRPDRRNNPTRLLLVECPQRPATLWLDTRELSRVDRGAMPLLGSQLAAAPPPTLHPPPTRCRLLLPLLPLPLPPPPLAGWPGGE